MRLDGVKVVLFYAWPGPIFEGKGELQAVIDAQADASQREAMLSIMYGEHTNEAATHWWVYHAMSDTVHDPLVKPIELDVDIDRRTARVVIPGLLESIGSPIRSPATGDEHQVRIQMPSGVEFDVAEIGNGTTEASGAIKLDLKNTYGQWNMVRQNAGGVVRS